ncbi:hypothetical protein NDU88_006692 [Pleurodeles waltl]|uniref:Uncharacterized protein n=1 Tax=Pleurodeles waltl TaxID=8319 RepID=A0AAV7TZ44_PLEWA|nr:hypothetical protein NDU88_006692 [Pleurodeles waltl]
MVALFFPHLLVPIFISSPGHASWAVSTPNKVGGLHKRLPGPGLVPARGPHRDGSSPPIYRQWRDGGAHRFRAGRVGRSVRAGQGRLSSSARPKPRQLAPLRHVRRSVVRSSGPIHAAVAPICRCGAPEPAVHLGGPGISPTQHSERGMPPASPQGKRLCQAWRGALTARARHVCWLGHAPWPTLIYAIDPLKIAGHHTWESNIRLRAPLKGG